jgi:serine/threonine protein kinase
MCAPNDVWSLGVILVNLTCGRNPWRQASFEDSTYRAYAKSRDFLKTILPLSDELNDILARVFHLNPEQRISLTELREKISACSHFTVKHEPSVSPLCSPKPGPMTPPASPDHATIDSTSRLNVRGFKNDPVPFGVVPLSPDPSPRPLGANDDAAGTGVDAPRLCDDQHATVPLSPAPSDSSMSDAASSGSSSARSTVSSCSSLDGDGYECDLLEDDVDDGMHVDVPEIKTPPPEAPAYQQAPIIYEDENNEAVASNGRIMAHIPLEYPVMPHYTGPMPGAPAPLPPPQQQQHLHQAHHHLQLVVPSSCCLPAVAPMPLHSSSPLHHGCAPWGETFVKAFQHDLYHQPHQPQLYHPVPLYHQAFPFATWQIGCY